MQVLYVTEFLVEGTDPETPIGDIVDDLLGVLGDWLGDPVRLSSHLNYKMTDTVTCGRLMARSANQQNGTICRQEKTGRRESRSDRPLHPRTSLSPG